MSACPSRHYTKITPAIWSCLKGKAAKYGIKITTNSGKATKDGFTVKWKYAPDAQTLDLQCTDSPFWATCSKINSEMDNVVKSCR